MGACVRETIDDISDSRQEEEDYLVDVVTGFGKGSFMAEHNVYNSHFRMTRSSSDKINKREKDLQKQHRAAQLSVADQVDILIDLATDDNILARQYAGLHPYA